MAAEIRPHTIELLGGYTDDTGVTHTRVTFSKRLTGRNYFQLDDDPQGNFGTQYEALLLRQAISEFGSLPMPVPLQIMLALDSIDRNDLNEAFNQFSRDSLRAITGLDPDSLAPDESAVKLLDERTLKLAIGYTRNDLTYDRVEFGKRLTGFDEVNADVLGLKGLRRTLYLAGLQVVNLSQSEGGASLPGPIGLDIFERLDSMDLFAIRAGSEVWRQTFRLPGRAFPAKRPGANSAGAGARDGMVGADDFGPVN